MKKLVILLIFCFIPKSYACICIKVWTDWNKSETTAFVARTDVIFIGELKSLSHEEGCYEFKILEVFKGNVEIGSLVTGYYITSCSAMPVLYGDYLFTVTTKLLTGKQNWATVSVVLPRE